MKALKIIIVIVLALVAAGAALFFTSDAEDEQAEIEAEAYKAKVERAAEDFEALKTALRRHKLHTGAFPEKLSDLQIPPEEASANWAGPYLKEQESLKDPWGGEYQYSAEKDKYELFSLGADGKKGGEDENLDLDPSKVESILKKKPEEETSE